MKIGENCQADMNITKWSTQNKVTILVILLAIIVGGVFTYLSIPILEAPDIPTRRATITTVLPGASPQQIECLVTDKLENSILEMNEIKNVFSRSTDGVSTISVNVLERYNDLTSVWNKLEKKINGTRTIMPVGTSNPVINTYNEPFDIIIAAIGIEHTQFAIKNFADNIQKKLMTLEGIGNIDFFGIQDNNIVVEFSHGKLTEHGISPSIIADILSNTDPFHPEVNALWGSEKVKVGHSFRFTSLDQIKQLPFKLPDMSTAVKLQNITDIKHTSENPPGTLTRFNGHPAIIIAIDLTDGHTGTEQSSHIIKSLKAFSASFSDKIMFEIVVDQPKTVGREVNKLMSYFLYGLCLAIIAVLLLIGLRSGLLICLFVSSVILSCILFMPAINVALHKISIISIMISMGIATGNAITISENFLNRLNQRENRLKSASNVTSNLWKPLLISSLAASLCFLPIYIGESAAEIFYSSMFVIILLTILLSWLLSVTLVPVLCSFFLVPATPQPFSGQFFRAYRWFIVGVLRHKIPFILACIALIAVSLWGLKSIPQTYFPPNNGKIFLVDFFQPSGTDIFTTVHRASKLEKFLVSANEVASVTTFAGSRGPRWHSSLDMDMTGSHFARLIINTRSYNKAPQLITQTQTFLNENFPDAYYRVHMPENCPPVNAPIQLRLSGDTMEDIYRLRDAIIPVISNVPGVINITDDWGQWSKKIEIDVHEELIKKAGFTSQDIEFSLQTQISGLKTGYLLENDQMLPIILRSKNYIQKNLGNIKSLQLFSLKDDSTLPLSEFVKTKLTWQPSVINRIDQVRTMTINADIFARQTSDAMVEITEKINQLKTTGNWPTGCLLTYGGEIEKRYETKKSLSTGYFLTMGVILFLLVLLFGSIRHPLVIIFTMPALSIGVSSVLLITNNTFGFIAILGATGLLGIMMYNMMGLISQIEQERSEGQKIQNAVVISAQKQLHPMAITNITTMLCFALLLFQADALFHPMAIILIFGLPISTLFALPLCLALYAFLFEADFSKYK